MTSLSNEAPLLLLTALIFLIIARRSYLMARGVPYSVERLVGQAALYLFLLAFTLVFDLEVLPVWTLAIDVGLLAVGAGIASVHVRRVTEFTQRDDGRWIYRLGLLLPAVYLGLYVVRVIVELLLVPSALGMSGTIPSLDALQQVALATVEAL
ncbi:MAG TPA: hypothetical protein VMH90_04540, partial [Thermoplasmata archaeon]|nr:hypothetical protein [Thermoplasmata archaeon]